MILLYKPSLFSVYLSLVSSNGVKIKVTSTEATIWDEAILNGRNSARGVGGAGAPDVLSVMEEETLGGPWDDLWNSKGVSTAVYS